MRQRWIFLTPKRIPRLPTCARSGTRRKLTRAYLEELAAADLRREVKPGFWDEDEAPMTVYQALTQGAFHSADHRSQILAQVDALGGKTVGQDFLDYLGERA